MKKSILIFFLLFTISACLQAQTWTELEKEYLDLSNGKQDSLALLKAKELNAWVVKNEADTTLKKIQAYLYLGKEYEKNNLDSSFFYFQKAENIIFKKAENSKEFASVLYEIGKDYYDINYFKIAELFLKRSLLMQVAFPLEPSLYINTLDFLSQCSSNQNNYEKEEYFLLKLQSYIFDFTELSDQKRSIILNRLGNLYFNISNLKKAEEHYLLSLKLDSTFNRIETPFSQNGLLNYGNLLYQNGNYKSAELIYLELLKNIKNNSNNDLMNALVLNNLGCLYLDISKKDSAEFYLNKSYEIRLSNLGNQHSLVAESAINLGNLYSSVSEYERAEHFYLVATNILLIYYKAGYNRVSYSDIIDNLGLLYLEKGENGKALSYLEKAYTIRKTLNDVNHPKIASSLNNLAIFYDEIGNYNISDSLFRIVADINKLNYGVNHKNYASAIMNIGLSKLNQGKPDEALFYLYESQEIMKSIFGANDYQVLNYNLNISNSLLVKKEYLKAIELLNSTLTERDNFNLNDKINILLNLGLAHIGKKDNEKGLNYLKQAYLISEKNTSINQNDIALKNLAFFYSNNQKTDSAFVYFNKYYEKINGNIKLNVFTLGLKDRELFWLKTSKELESILSFFISDSKSILKSKLIAYDINLISHSLLIESITVLNKTVKNSKDFTSINLYNELKSTLRYLSKLESEGSTNYTLINKLSTEADSLDKILVNKFGAYAEMKKKLQINYNDVKSNLSNNEAAIEFTRYYDYNDTAYYYSALIAHKNFEFPQLVKLCSEKELKNLSPEKELNEIYKLVWQPLEQHLAGIKTIYYSPSGLLNNIPFHALYANKDDVRNYVMDNYTLHQLTSTRYLALGLKQKDNTIKETSIALFGGVNYNEFTTNSTLANDTLKQIAEEASFLYKNAIATRDIDEIRYGISYLPATKQEVENIETLLKTKNWQVDISKGIEASENKIKSYSGVNSKSILHIATHGFAFSEKEEAKDKTRMLLDLGNTKFKVADNPMIRSGLLFSGANQTWTGQEDSLNINNGEDGILTAYELSQLELDKTELVVLSACETGKGAIHSTEGTFGLKRALKLAGVDNMIVSLWKVPDAATMEMMTLFYEELAESKNPLTSFETAQKTMRFKYPDEPSKWAGFVFVR